MQQGKPPAKRTTDVEAIYAYLNGVWGARELNRSWPLGAPTALKAVAEVRDGQERVLQVLETGDWGFFGFFRSVAFFVDRALTITLFPAPYASAATLAGTVFEVERAAPDLLEITDTLTVHGNPAVKDEIFLTRLEVARAWLHAVALKIATTVVSRRDPQAYPSKFRNVTVPLPETFRVRVKAALYAQTAPTTPVPHGLRWTPYVAPFSLERPAVIEWVRPAITFTMAVTALQADHRFVYSRIFGRRISAAGTWGFFCRGDEEKGGKRKPFFVGSGTNPGGEAGVYACTWDEDAKTWVAGHPGERPKIEDIESMLDKINTIDSALSFPDLFAVENLRLTE